MEDTYDVFIEEISSTNCWYGILKNNKEMFWYPNNSIEDFPSHTAAYPVSKDIVGAYNYNEEEGTLFYATEEVLICEYKNIKRICSGLLKEEVLNHIRAYNALLPK